MQDLLTLKEIAKQLGVPESNLRYYKNRVGDFLPSVGKGRRRRYLPESIDILRRTIDLLHEGMTLDRVYKHLAQEQPEVEQQGGVSREEFAEKIAGRVVEALVSSGGPATGGDAVALNEILEILRESLAACRSEAEGLAAEGRRIEASLVEAVARVSSLEKELAETKGRLAEAVLALEEKEEQLREKDRIVDLQRQQLLDARDKRLNIIEELQQIKSLLGAVAG